MSNIFEIKTYEDGYFEIIQQPSSIERGCYRYKHKTIFDNYWWVCSSSSPQAGRDTFFIRGISTRYDNKRMHNYKRWKNRIKQWCADEMFILIVDGVNESINLGTL